MKPTKEEFYIKFNDFIKENNPTLSFEGEDKVSSILLFKDFMRRLNIWKECLHTKFNNFDRKNLNLFNDLNFDNSLLEEYESFSEYIRLNFDNYSGLNYNYFFIYIYIYWELYKNSLEINGCEDVENPYESIVKIVANKNMVYKREGINVCNITMRDLSKPFKLPSLDDNFLKYIDSKCKLVGSGGIPNQNETDELWREFQQLK